MSEIGDTFNILKDYNKKKRKGNRCHGATRLTEEGISFERKNNGAHLIVETSNGKIDYWPGTGRWISRKGDRGFGIAKLLSHIKRQQ